MMLPIALWIPIAPHTLACSDAPVRPQPTPVDTGDGGQGSDSPAGPTVELLTPVDGAPWFTNTRYDIVVRSSGLSNTTATLSGEPLSCGPPVQDLLHCTATVEEAATYSLEIRGTAPDGESIVTASIKARAPEGVVPEGEAFAMGAYQVMQEEWFPTVATAGFNLAQSYGTGAYDQTTWQDWAVQAGLGTMTRPSWDWQNPWGNISEPETLAALAERPELVWWELPELPVEDDAYVADVADVADLIRAHDDRPLQMYFWTSSTPEHIAPYVPDVQVISPGAYPAHACQVQPWIRWRIESAREAVAMAGYSEQERPVVGTADLYSRAEAACPELKSELAHVRMNPLAQIAAGARGVLYFAWRYAENDLDPAWKESALATADLIVGESGLGLAVIHGEPVGAVDTLVLEGPEWSEAFTPANTDTPVQYPSLHAAAWDYSGTRFFVVVNYTDESIRAEIAGFPEGSPLAVEAIGEDRELEVIDGTVTDSFEAWAAHVYRTPNWPL